MLFIAFIKSSDSSFSLSLKFSYCAQIFYLKEELGGGGGGSILGNALFLVQGRLTEEEGQVQLSSS
jgi:hypothetical protein